MLMPSIDNLALECDRTITNLTKDDQPELSAMLLKLMEEVGEVARTWTRDNEGRYNDSSVETELIDTLTTLLRICSRALPYGSIQPRLQAHLAELSTRELHRLKP